MGGCVEDPSVVRNKVSQWSETQSVVPSKISLWFADWIPATNYVVKGFLDLTLPLSGRRQQVPLKHRRVLANKTNKLRLIQIHTLSI